MLPSPNGSAIAAAAQGGTVVAGCPRNASAVGRWLTSNGYGSPTHPVDDVAHTLASCASGQELTEYGFADDVAIAGELGASDIVPVIDDAAFIDAGAGGPR